MSYRIVAGIKLSETALIDLQVEMGRRGWHVMQVQFVNPVLAAGESGFLEKIFHGLVPRSGDKFSTQIFCPGETGLLRDAVQKGFFNSTAKRAAAHQK